MFLTFNNSTIPPIIPAVPRRISLFISQLKEQMFAEHMFLCYNCTSISVYIR